MSLDVTPVGGAPGARAGDGTRTGPSGDDDPFGSRPSRRRPGWIRVVAGVLLVVAGVVATIAGILDAVGEHGRIEADAVARGVVSVEPVEAVGFTVPPGERRRFTVYLQFDGVENNTPDQELAVRDTGCTATMPDGVTTTFRGARQGVSSTLGASASVGHFSSQPGRVAVRCAYVSGTLRSARRRPDRVPYVVTPGTPSAATGGVLLIVGGVGAAVAGGFLAGWGLRRRR